MQPLQSNGESFFVALSNCLVRGDEISNRSKDVVICSTFLWVPWECSNQDMDTQFSFKEGMRLFFTPWQATAYFVSIASCKKSPLF